MLKRMVLALCAAVLLCGCTADDGQLDRAMNLRAQMIAKEVSFDAQILADYGDKTYEFAMKCQAGTDGTLRFSVTEPKTISGISGTVAEKGGKLTFDDVALSFDLMADGQLNPVSAPWVLVKTLRSGYLTSCCEEEGGLRIAIDDSYEEDALHLDIWLNEQDEPRQAEIYWQGRRLLSIGITNFQMA